MKKLVILLLFISHSYSQSSGLSRDEILNYIKELDSIISVAPTPNDYYLRGVQKYHIQEYNDAIEDFNSCIDSNDKSPESYFYRGICLESLKQYRSALNDYNKSLNLNPNFVDAISRRAYCKTILKDFEGAVKDYDLLIELKPTSTNFNNRGLAYTKINQNSIAISDFNKAINLDSKNIEALENRAQAKAFINDKTAIIDFNKVIELNPKNGKSYFNRAIHLLNNKLKGDYCSDLRKSLDLGFKEAENILKEVCK